MSEAETPVESVTATPEPRPGRTLAEARERRNQTIAEVAQQLKLSATQIEALEADDYARLPGPVFVRGFVRNYARLMELDSEALVAALALPQDQSPAGAAIPHSHNIPFPDGRGPRWPIYAVGIAVLAAIVVLFEFIFSTPPAAVVTTVPPRQEASLPRETSPAPPQPGAVADGAQAPEMAVSAPVATEPLATEEAAPSAPAKRSGLAELQFAFDNQSWVEVRDRDDRIVFSQLNPAGAVQHVQGRPPLNVVIGNARGVRVNYNGRPVDLAPHTRVEVARFTLE
jgi:cytoskeleton protein RodZ